MTRANFHFTFGMFVRIPSEAPDEKRKCRRGESAEECSTPQARRANDKQPLHIVRMILANKRTFDLTGDKRNRQLFFAPSATGITKLGKLERTEAPALI